MPDAGLQGDAHAGPARHVLSRRPGRPVARQRPGDVPLAVQHQHVPVVGARPPVPDDLSQWRDQHAPGQHQLDEGPRGPVRVRPVRAGRRQEADPDHPRGALRHRVPRQRRGIARQERLRPGPDDDDARPRGVGEPRDHEPGEEGLLRLPLLPDGAVGRPGVDRLHRRQGHRRGPGPQRPPPQPLLRDQGRPGHHGVRDGHAQHPARGDRLQGPAGAGPDVPRRPGAGPDRRRRGAQAPDRDREALRRMAEDVRDPPDRPARCPARPRPRPRDAPPPPAGLRVHARGPEIHPRADGEPRRGGDRLDGDRHAPGRPVRPPPIAVQLLQATVRAGHQSAPGCDPGGARHVGPHRGRSRGEPPDAHPRERPTDLPGDADPRQRRDRQAQEARRGARVPIRRAAHAVRRRRRGERHGGGPGRPLPPGLDRARPRREPADPVPPGDHPQVRADPLAPGRRGAASSHGPPGLADPRGAGRRVRGRPGGPPLRPAPGLRGGVDQPVSRLRDARRHDHPRDHQGRDRPPRGRQALSQGDQERRRQGDVQDGHLDDPELPRGPDLRGDRPRGPFRREVLRQDPEPDRRRRPRGDRRGDALSPSPGPRPEGGRPPDAGRGRPVPVAARRRVPPVQPRDRLPPPARHPLRQVRGLQAVHEAGGRPVRAAMHAPRPLRLQARDAPAGADRRGRARRIDPEAVRHRGDVLRLDLGRGA